MIIFLTVMTMTFVNALREAPLKKEQYPLSLFIYYKVLTRVVLSYTASTIHTRKWLGSILKDKSLTRELNITLLFISIHKPANVHTY